MPSPGASTQLTGDAGEASRLDVEATCGDPGEALYGPHVSNKKRSNWDKTRGVRGKRRVRCNVGSNTLSCVEVPRSGGMHPASRVFA